jgi:hypothetical protein
MNYIDTFDLIECDDARTITIQCEQYRGIIHLFIGTGRRPSKNTFMTLTYSHNRDIKHQILANLFFFGSASCLTFIVSLSRSRCPSTFVVIGLRQCLCLEDLRRGRRSSSQQNFSYDEVPIIFNSTLETNG